MSGAAAPFGFHVVLTDTAGRGCEREREHEHK